MVFLIMAWIGYTLATAPPSMPLGGLDFETSVEFIDEEKNEET